MSKQLKALKNLSAKELATKTRELEKSIFDARLKKATGQLGDVSSIWRLRKELARVKTLETASQAKGK